ncbi:unnamed protein product, partial [Meganyctiphanes norvegica]
MTKKSELPLWPNQTQKDRWRSARCSGLTRFRRPLGRVGLSLLSTSQISFDKELTDRGLIQLISPWEEALPAMEPPLGLEEFLLPDALEQVPDMYVIGTQESGGDRSEWEIRLQGTIGPSHVLFSSTVLGVLHLTIYLRRDLLWFCSVPEDASYSLRPGTYWKTKGCVAIGFQFFGTRMLFISSHLTAHEEKQSQRIQNFKSITHSLDLPRVLPTRQKHKKRYKMGPLKGNLFALYIFRNKLFVSLIIVRDDSFFSLALYQHFCKLRYEAENFREHSHMVGRFTTFPAFKMSPSKIYYDAACKSPLPTPDNDCSVYRLIHGGANFFKFYLCTLMLSRMCGIQAAWKLQTGFHKMCNHDLSFCSLMFKSDTNIEALQ